MRPGAPGEPNPAGASPKGKPFLFFLPMRPSLPTESPEPAPAQLEARHEAWRQARQAELAGPESWLGLAGLYWLEPGANQVGSAPDNAVILPRGPARLGTLVWEGEAVHWYPASSGETRREWGGAGDTQQAPGAATTPRSGDAWEFPLADDRDGAPDRVCLGELAFFLIRRGARLGVRVRDRAWATRRPFTGVPAYPFDPAWRLTGRWVPLEAPRTLLVPDVTGEERPVTVAYGARFTLAGQDYELLPQRVGADGVLLVFRDQGSGRETYGGGRFLHCPPPENGAILLDFNRAYNPPCAFTPFATCPLPPPENWLPLAIAAGERKWAGHA